MTTLFNKRHYEWLADFLHKELGCNNTTQLILHLSREFSKDDPTYKSSIFEHRAIKGK